MGRFSIRVTSRYMVMINIACVYYGDKYTFKYVENLYNMVKTNFTIPHRFICFTDNTVIHKQRGLKIKI